MDFHVSVTYGVLGRVRFNDWFRDNFGTRELQVQTCPTTPIMVRDITGLGRSLKCPLNCPPAGGLLFGVGDMAIHAEVTPEVIRESRDLILGPETRDDGDGNLILVHLRLIFFVQPKIFLSPKTINID